MSVELEKKLIKNHRTLKATGTKASMDNDIIVPDTQPDVKKVLQAEVLPMICEKRVQRDYIILSGNLDYSIIYLSDEKDALPCVRSISARIPFTHQIEVSGAQDAVFAGIAPCVARVDVSAVNSRKINVKSTIDFECCIIAYDDFEAVCSASCEGELPCKNREVETFALSAYCENEFELTDTLSIPSGSEMIDELLKVDVKVNSREVKSISGKPVAKGSLEIHGLFVDTAGRIQCIDGDVPFTEILSVDDVGADDLCEVEYSICDLQYSAASDGDGDISMLDIRACVNISACVYRKSVDYITEDLYSPDFDILAARDTISVNCLKGGESEASVVKELIKLDSEEVPIAKVYNVIAKPRVESAEIKGGRAHISGVADTQVLYISSAAESPVCSVKKEIPFSYSVMADCPEDADINVICSAENMRFGSLSPTEAEVEFDLNFDTKIITREKLSYIKDAEESEYSSEVSSCRPGIVIYFASAGESMWDIAKHYRTTSQAITDANGCEFPEILTEPKKIMIPKKKVVVKV